MVFLNTIVPSMERQERQQQLLAAYTQLLNNVPMNKKKKSSDKSSGVVTQLNDWGRRHLHQNKRRIFNQCHDPPVSEKNYSTTVVQKSS